MSLKVCVLIPEIPHKKTKSPKFMHRSMKYFGLGVIVREICDKFEIEVPYVDHTQVHKFDIVLYSIHSVEDFYNLVHTVKFKMKRKRKNIWIGGGAGVANLELLIAYFDYIVIGRAERLIIDLLAAIQYNKVLVSPSVVITSEYNSSNVYKIQYADRLYDKSIMNRKETMYGCKYNCFYCRYRFSALPPNKRELDNKTTMPGNEETFWELEIVDSRSYTTSLDGFTEATRYRVNKRISNQRIIDKLVAVPVLKHSVNLKVYFIAGYPFEKEIDITEFIETIEKADLKGVNNKTFLRVHVTPFSAEPNTPMQWESMNTKINLRNMFKEFQVTNGILFKGKDIQVVMPNLISSEFTLMKRAIYNRAFASDSHIIDFIMSNPFMKNHNKTHTQKIEYLKSKFDLEPFIKEYPIGSTLSSSNIHSWESHDRIIKMATQFRANSLKKSPKSEEYANRL